jgi:hypothetical protein
VLFFVKPATLALLMLKTMGKFALKAMLRQKPAKRVHMCCSGIWRIMALPMMEMLRLAARK